ncbi:ADAM 17-like protease [Contarinia nasturtii]|uniref:ADAM 17-like protease n=1 Tax=Contarinia nasturtii TaxID=265458 RepID=UPI0012D40127|nr:ADAM 17-like protease [Contarinia nasturtii]
MYMLYASLPTLKAELSKNLHYYESIHADDIVYRVFNVSKEVEFNAFGQHFRIILHPQRDILHRNFKAYSVDALGNKTIIDCDHDTLYTGQVFGEPESSVRAQIEDEIITAKIDLLDETYHIEPSWRHLPHLSDRHMIAYKQSDVKLSWMSNETAKKKFGHRTWIWP